MEILNDYNVNTYCVFGELSEEAEVNQLIKQVQDLNISIDILYNNAAVMTPYYTDFWGHTWEDWTLSMKVNVFAMFSLCRAFIPAMIENGFSRIINLTSGIKGEPELAPYGASKWAVDKLTDDLSVKVKDTSVRINTLDPGWCRTDLGGEKADHAVEEVLPGALAPALIADDGPNGDKQDRRFVTYDSEFPAKAFVDDQGSFASNEVCLNWNAPAVFVLGYLQ